MTQTLQSGMKAPTFIAQALVDGVMKEIDLLECKRSFELQQYVILLFNPGNSAFSAIMNFSDRADEIRNAWQAQIVAISSNSADKLLAQVVMERSEGGLGPVNYPIVTDQDMSISDLYGVQTESDVISIFIINQQGFVERQWNVHATEAETLVEETVKILKELKRTNNERDKTGPI